MLSCKTGFFFFLAHRTVSLLSPTSSRISNKNKLGQEDLEVQQCSANYVACLAGELGCGFVPVF